MRYIHAKDFAFIMVFACTLYMLTNVLFSTHTVTFVELKHELDYYNPISELSLVIFPEDETISERALDNHVNVVRETEEPPASDDENGKVKHNYFMVIFIPSMPKSSMQRQYLRAKWLNMSHWNENEFKGIEKQYLTFKLMFVIGKVTNKEYSEEFLKEVSETDDIYLIDTEESRSILSVKLLWGMKKSVELFNFTYFVKVDHDTLIDLPHLIRGLSVEQRENLYTGWCNKKLKSTIYKRTFRYCLGGGYILSHDLIEKISLLKENVTDIGMPMEDGYAGYLVSKVVKQYNITGTIPRHTFNALQIYAKSNFVFNKYFYHWLKKFGHMDMVFECRIKTNKTMCPSMMYEFPEGKDHCMCIVESTI